MTGYTLDQKIAMYRAGKYVCNSPPVSTIRWNTGSWIMFIDSCNGWRPAAPVHVNAGINENPNIRPEIPR